MPTNIEIKAALTDVEAAERIAARLSGTGPETIQQSDTFFRCATARLKLRVFGSGYGELIRYQRSNEAGPRGSHYSIARTQDPQALLDILSDALGVVGVVRKTRRLYIVSSETTPAMQTRIHIDNVEGLGRFLELEVVVGFGQNEAQARQVMQDLLSHFDVRQEQFVPVAYIDLMLGTT